MIVASALVARGSRQNRPLVFLLFAFVATMPNGWGMHHYCSWFVGSGFALGRLRFGLIIASALAARSKTTPSVSLLFAFDATIQIGWAVFRERYCRGISWECPARPRCPFLCWYRVSPGVVGSASCANSVCSGVRCCFPLGENASGSRSLLIVES